VVTMLKDFVDSTRVTVVDVIALAYLNLVGASVALTIIFKCSQRIQLRRTLQTSIVAAIPAPPLNQSPCLLIVKLICQAVLPPQR
jgi:hypothetical protein